MSELCRGASDSSSEHDTIHPSNLDLAGKYVLHLQFLHQKCSGLPNFRLDPNYGGLLPPLAIPPPLAASFASPHPRLTEPNHLRQLSQSGQSPHDAGNTVGHMYGSSNTIPFSTQSPTSAISPRSQAHVRRPTGLSPTWYTTVNNIEDRSAGLQSMQEEVNRLNSHDTAELLAVSNQLMDQEFLDMDRVITLDDMDFALGFDLWNYA
jgi:hypothetical protein